MTLLGQKVSTDNSDAFSLGLLKNQYFSSSDGMLE
jgi:hypothetical protein